MEIETTGKYQLHMFAVELAADRWDAYVSVVQFDERIDDFFMVVDRLPVPGGAFADERSALDAARIIGNQLLETEQVRKPAQE